MSYRSLTQLARDSVARILRPGDSAIDATVGNGHDTLHLARQIAPDGQVIGMDIQQQALDAARSRLAEHAVAEYVRLIRTDHGDPRAWQAVGPAPRAIMFNLGYLPGSDKRLVTRPASTVLAVRHALRTLAPGGILSILAYRGHPGGTAEAAALKALVASLDRQAFSARLEGVDGGDQTPELYLLGKTGA